MKKQYRCPKCRGHLKVGEYIILLIKNKIHQKGLILLHPEVGNYSSIKHPSLTITKNEEVEFSCPVCQFNLASDFDKNLSHLILEENDKSYDIYFSRISGEKSTFLVDGEKVTVTGEHSDKYTYFKMGDKFKQYLRK